MFWNGTANDVDHRGYRWGHDGGGVLNDATEKPRIRAAQFPSGVNRLIGTFAALLSAQGGSAVAPGFGILGAIAGYVFGYKLSANEVDSD